MLHMIPILKVKSKKEDERIFIPTHPLSFYSRHLIL